MAGDLFATPHEHPPAALRPTTLTERKIVEARRRKLGADAVVRELQAYGRERNGRFVLFGSYVTGSLRFDSDLDILIDFPFPETANAWLFAEDACARHGVVPDLHDARTSKLAFVERVLDRGRVLS